MPTYRLEVAYDGSGFHGYASQPGLPTVQGSLEEALFRHTGAVETAVAGRTDRGVHASGQVVSFTTTDPLDTSAVLRSLNRQMAPAIACATLTEAADDFHARFSATYRAYRYGILNRETPDPFLAATTWHYATLLDEAAMHDAAQPLVGEHDFASFCKRSGKPTVRNVHLVTWLRRSDVVELTIAASSFCHQMVRSIVAASVDVGRGKLPPDAIGHILKACDRDESRGAAPPHGLTLTEVGYPA